MLERMVSVHTRSTSTRVRDTRSATKQTRPTRRVRQTKQQSAQALQQQVRGPQKVVTAKRLRERQAQTQAVLEQRERRQILREKPKLRGWLHFIAFPFSIATSVLLIILAPGGWMKAAVSVYGATVMLLFGTSAALHLGHGYFPKRVDDVLCRIDYSNIFLVIAGTCTPFLFALQNTTVRWTYIGIMWITAIVGTILHLIFPDGYDWVFTIIYCVLGLAPITIIHLFWMSPFIGPIPTILVIAGGASYIIGAVFFALRRPNPFPRWFGYHELFHLFTIGGYVCHVIALFMTVLTMR